jgi:hypothetical protein
LPKRIGLCEWAKFPDFAEKNVDYSWRDSVFRRIQGEDVSLEELKKGFKDAQENLTEQARFGLTLREYTYSLMVKRMSDWDEEKLKAMMQVLFEAGRRLKRGKWAQRGE